MPICTYPRHRSTPLLQASNVHNISRSVDFNTTSLLHNILKNPSGASKFYTWLLNGHVHCPKLLTSRVKQICQDHDFNFLKHASLVTTIMSLIKLSMVTIASVDSVRHLGLSQYKSDNNSSLLRLILKVFKYTINKSCMCTSCNLCVLLCTFSFL